MVEDMLGAARAVAGARVVWSRLSPYAAVELSFPALAVAGLALTVAPHTQGLALFATVTTMLAITANAAFSLIRTAAHADRLNESAAAVAQGVAAIDKATAAVQAALNGVRPVADKPALAEVLSERVPEPAGTVVNAPVFEAGRPLRVLVAEANGVHQLMLRTLLAQIGVEPELVCDATAVLEAWRREPWDLILIDMQAPEIGGPNLAAMIRSAEAKAGWPLTAIVALGAAGESDFGVDASVAKPILGARLFQAMELAMAAPETMELSPMGLAEVA